MHTKTNMSTVSGWKCSGDNYDQGRAEYARNMTFVLLDTAQGTGGDVDALGSS